MLPDIFVLALDYSISSPSVCSFRGKLGDEFSLKRCSFSYVHLKTESQTPLSQYCQMAISCRYPAWKTPEERYHAVYTEVVWPMIVETDELNKIAMVEGYSFGSKGQTFQIAENCGYTKVELHKRGFAVNTAAPTTIKKFATGNGRAEKPEMIRAFVNQTGLDIHNLLTPNKKLGTSPVSDIVDSYFLCQYQWNNLKGAS